MSVSKNLADIQQQICDSEYRYRRTPGSVYLLAVSKNQSVQAIEEAYTAGQYAFGENYLQEALPKILQLAHLSIAWHFIGAIQDNKTKSIAEHFSWVHSVSKLKTATRLNEQRPSHLPPLNICLQINTSQETTKSGVHPDQALELAIACAKLPSLRLRGLMTIPSTSNASAEFAQCRALLNTLCEAGLSLDTLSMGMSNDVDAAISEGATIVRIGRAIFGRRQ